MRVLITGAYGRLGLELVPKLNFPDWQLFIPTKHELNIVDECQVGEKLTEIQPDVVLHLAAYTDVAKAEIEKDVCWQVNVIGTRNIAKYASKLVHISTDYLFDGQKGNYKELDTPNPINYYALTKLVAEESARLIDNHLIIRTSFKESKWPYQSAFVDQFTSADYIDVIADELVVLLNDLNKIMKKTKVIHLATERKSVFELAKRRNPKIKPSSYLDVQVHIPPDISLNTDLWKNIKREL